MPTIKSGIWPKTWPISRSSITTCAGKNRTPCEPLLALMLSAASSHTSSTMPQRPRISCGLCLTPASTTLRTGGSTALNSTTSAVNGAKGVGTPCVTVRESTSVCSAMGTDTKNSSATSHINDAGWEECAASPTTIQGWLTPTAHQTLGPSDDGKDINKGVMSRETSHT
jgi:hypothetical protein